MSKSNVESGVSHWQEKNAAGLRKLGKHFASWGDKTGITGGALMMMTSAAMIAGGASTGNPEAAALLGTAAGALVVSGALKLGGATDAEEMARKHLPGGEAVFNTPSRPRGATPVSDPMFTDPDIQKVLLAVQEDFANDPEAKMAIIEMLANSPTARNAMIQAQKNMELRDALVGKVGPENGERAAQSPDEDAPSITMH